MSPSATAAESPRPLARAGRRLLDRVSARGLAFPGLSLAVLGLYAVLRAPVLNHVAYLDAWIYWALFKNFDYLYSTFTWAYWTSRLPWILPGIGANALLPPLGAYFLLHIAFFLAGASFIFLLARRYYGERVALVGAGVIMLSPLFFDAHSNDYPDGATITYLLGAAYFSLGAFGSRRRTVRLGAAGFFAAAAFGTQIYAAVAIIGLILAYVIVFHVERRFLRVLVRDAVAASAGALTLLVACGTVARTHGGEFLFFMPSWRYAQTIELSRWKRPGYEWMLQESQLLIPLFLLALLGVLLLRTRLRGWRSDAGLRLAAASGAFLLYMLVFLGIWEFWGGGDFFEVYYYFSLFLVPAALVLPAVLHLSARVAGVTVAKRDVLAAVAAAAAPLVVLYGFGVGPVDRPGFYLTTGLMAASLVAAAGLPALKRGRRSLLVPAGASLVVVLVGAATAYAGASGYTTRIVFGEDDTFAARRAALSEAGQLIQFVRSSGLQNDSPPPNFWYDGYANPQLNGIQSTYLWQITWIGREMPRVDPGVRKMLDDRRPPNIVLLCAAPSCGGGPAALRRAGYPLRLRAETVIASRGDRFWVKAFRLTRFKTFGTGTVWWGSSQAAFVAAPVGRTLQRWTLRDGLPKEWDSTEPVRAGPRYAAVTTDPAPWRYVVMSPPITLPRGSYQVYLRGRVLKGGLDLGILDLDAGTWSSQRTYWYGQSGFSRHWMATPFSVERTKRIQVVLSNWVPHDMRSEWRLGEIRLVRLP